MAESPTTFQQGQGLAQIFQGNMAADVYAYQQQLRAQQEAERRKKADLAAKELSGQFDALNKKNIFETRDTDEFRNKVDGLRTKYAGKWEELYKGDTPLRRDLEKDILDVSLWADQSAASKKELQGIWKDAFQDNADKYTDEQRAVVENLMTTPGSFDIPYKQLIPFENIDLEKTFQDLAYKPAAQEAVDRFTSDDSWRGLQNYGSIKQTKLPEESVEAYWSQFINDPKVQNALYHQYGAEAEAAGEDLIEYVKKNTPYYDRLKINKKQTASGLIKDSGEDKAFNASLITGLDKNQNVNFWNKVSIPSERNKGAIPFYPINYSVSVPSNNAKDWATGDKIRSGALLNGNVTGYTVIDKMPYALVRTVDGYDISVPVEQVVNQGKSKGYDVENIVNGLLQTTQGPAPKRMEISSSEIAGKAAAAGYTTEEYTNLLKQKGVKIIE